jgi:hypothetical protein
MEWTEHKDQKSGKVYFYNKSTKKSTYTRPEELSWEEKYDKNNKRSYYYNKTSKKSQWEKPAKFTPLAAAATTSATPAPAAAAAAPAAAAAAVAGSDWAEKLDPKSGRKYYYNKKTRESSWKKPEGFLGGDATTAGVAAAGGETKLAVKQTDAQQTAASNTSTATQINAGTEGDGAAKPRSATPNEASRKDPSTPTNQPAAVVVPPSADELKKTLQAADSIMETNVLETVGAFMKGNGNAGLLVNMLAGNYRGYAQMCGLLMPLFEAIPDPNDEKQGDDMVIHHLQNLIEGNFDTKRADMVLGGPQGGKGPPEWLEAMLSEKSWRQLLVKLADTHGGCSLLSYAVQRISEEGHHEEILESSLSTLQQNKGSRKAGPAPTTSSASSYFKVLHGHSLCTHYALTMHSLYAHYTLTIHSLYAHYTPTYMLQGAARHPEE